MLGSARRDDGRVLRVSVSDLSYEGCNVLCEHDLEQGEVLTLSLPRMGDIQAQVRWARENKAGLSFLMGKSAVEDRRARLGV